MSVYYDIHAHLADARLQGEVESILSESAHRGVGGILATAARLSEWPEIVRLSRENAPVYGALGLHPFFVEDYSSDLPDRLRNELVQNPKLVAVGEIGLDFYHGRENIAVQVEAFGSQLQTAVDLGLPVVLHNRKSWNEFFPLWKQIAQGRSVGICHHFCGSVDVARQALDAGLYLSFCGPLTYPNAHRLKEAAAFAPLDRILTETDTPDLPGQNHRPEGFSRPWHVREIVGEIARLKGICSEDVSEAVETNFHRVLQLGG